MRVLRPLARLWTVLLTLAALTLALGLIARWLLPIAPWNEAPALGASSPVDGGVDVLPRSAITLSFSGPMNREATLAALQIAPATPGSFRWSEDSRQLTFTPSPSLLPGTDYTLTLGQGALGRWWRPVAAPRLIRFRTAPLPAVVAALPDSPGAPIDGSLAIIFSQAIVAADQVGAPASLPQLSIDPPVSAQLRWLDQTTLLIRPDAPLRAATRYTATISPDLTDLRGVDLGRPFSWSWSTAWPEPLARSPEDGARWVSPRQPLALALSAPLDEALLRSSLTITPPVEGDIETAAVGATQVITFTPRSGWEYGRSYEVSLAPAADPAISPPPDLGWRFNVEPEPALVAFFPGQGQALAAGQDVRLIFSTPMDEQALRAGLRIEPPVGELELQVRETEVRLRPALEPSSVYTLTVAADTLDRSGEPLGVTATVRLRSASAEPALRAPAATANALGLPAGAAAQIELERINLSRLELSLYRLDTPTVVRAMALAPDEWPDFSPERYGQALARGWGVDLGDPPDTLVRNSIPIAPVDGAPLDAGIYYLRVVAREGPRADLLLVVSPLALTMRQSESQVLLWATDRASGAPVAGAPLLLYAGESLVASGQTGDDGVWALPLQAAAGREPYLALADGPSPALVRADWLVPPPPAAGASYGGLLFLDRLAYQPGDSVQVGGAARRLAADGGLAMPAAGTPCRMSVEARAGLSAPSPQASCQVADNGSVSGSLRLSSRQPPGDYRLLVRIGNSATALDLRVEGPEPPARLALAASGDGQVQMTARRDGLPAVGATISWTVALEPLAIPADPDGFHFDDAPAQAEELSGAGTTDADGRLLVPLPARESLAAPVSYRLRAELRDGDATLATGQLDGAIRPRAGRVGLRLPARILLSDQRAIVELMARAADGAPAPGVRIGVQVYRRGDVGGPPLIARSAVSNAQGRADVQLVQLGPGAYEVVAAAGDSSSTAGLWVTRAGYAAWGNEPGQVSLVADRDSYRPGDVARLLVTTPYTRANLLLTADSGDLRLAELRDLRAGQVITLTITPEMAPAVSLGAVAAARGERLLGATSIAVDDGRPALEAAVASDSQQYTPGSTAVISVTTTAGGALAPAVLMVAVAPADAPGAELALQPLAPRPAGPVGTAMLEPAAPLGETPAPAQVAQGGAGYLVPPTDGVGGAGQAVLRVPLPDEVGRWAIRAFAMSGADQLALASTIVTTSAPLALTPDAPPALRPGDSAQASLLVRNTGVVTQELQVRLQAAGGDIDPATPADRRLLLVPGGAQRLVWSLGPRPGVRVVNLRYSVSGDGLSEQLARDLPVAAAAPEATQSVTLVGTGSLSATLPLSLPAGGQVELAVAPGVWATLADSASALAALPERGVEERAALLLISSALARASAGDGGAAWAALASQAAGELDAAQNADGGWGWWPGQPSRPYVSAFAVEAQAFARDALPDWPRPSQRAIDYLSRAGAGLDADTRAYLLYVRARAGSGDAAAARALAGEALGPDGLAYLALSLPQDATPALLDRLIALAEAQAAAAGSAEAISWPAGSPSALPRGATAVAAAAAQALRAGRPLAPEVAAAERGLLMRWGVEGWGGPFAAARVAAALRNQSIQPGGPRAVQLGDAALLDREDPLTATVRLRANVAAAGAPALRVAAAGPASYLVAMRAAADPPPGDGSPSTTLLYQEYVDPASGAPIDPDNMRVGQLVALRVTAVVARSALRANLEVALPATLQPIDSGLRPPFVHVAPAPAGLRAEAAELRPGVYTLQVVARVTSAGHFDAPGSRLLLVDEEAPPIIAPAGPPLTVTGAPGGNP